MRHSVATERLLAHTDFRDLTVDDVMVEAGLSRTLFYRHFDGLPQVVLALLAKIEAAWRAFVTRWVDETAALLPPTEDCYELARALNLMNVRYLMETLGHDPDFDRELAQRTLLTIWSAVARSLLE